MSGRDIDFVMNVFAAWTGVRWGELMAVEGWPGKDSPLQFPKTDIATYAVDWQLRELGGVGLQVSPEGRLVPRPGPAALPRRPRCAGPWTTASDTCSLPARRRQAGLQRRRPDAAQLPVPRPEGRPPPPLQLRRRLPDPGRRRPAPRPQGCPPPCLRHRRTLARHPHPPGQPQKQGRRPRRRHLAEPGRQVQAPRLPALARHLAGRRGREQGHPDGPPRPRHARHGPRLHARHLARCASASATSSKALARRARRALQDQPALTRAPAGRSTASPRDGPADRCRTRPQRRSDRQN